MTDEKLCNERGAFGFRLQSNSVRPFYIPHGCSASPFLNKHIQAVIELYSSTPRKVS